MEMFYGLALWLLLLSRQWSICSTQNSIVSTGKSADQISTYDSGGITYSASLAVDGNTATNFDSNSCSRTQQEVNPWWVVDLGGFYSVNYVLIYKADGYEDSLVGTEVRVSSDLESVLISNNQCGSAITSDMTTPNYYFIDCNPSFNGRYVSLYRSGDSNTLFTVCEVQVYGVLIIPNEPVVTCPNDITLGTSPGQSTATVTWSEPTVTDNIDTGLSATCTPSSGSTFYVDMTTVTCTSTDSDNNIGSCMFTVHVTDNQDPTITCGMDVSQSTDLNSNKATVVYYPGASDNVGVVSVICSPQSGSEFGVGSYPVQCTATDAAGNNADCSFNIIISDNQDPTITCGMDVSQSTDLNSKATVFYDDPVTSDNVGVYVMCNPPSGSEFDVGLYPVQCTATDIAGNTAGCSFNIIVTDGQAPDITCPDNTMSNTDPGSNQGTVTWNTPTATDNIDDVEDITIGCNMVSGSLFNIGDTEVTCTATDTAGGSNYCIFTVTVVDAESPTVTCPDDINENTASNQATVTWSEPVVTDNVDTGMSANCTPSSGSSFNDGETVVTCSASDTAGNEDSCMFVVKVFDGNAEKMSDGEDSNTTLTVVVALIVALVLLLVAIVLIWRIRAKRRIIKSPERITFSASKGISGNGLEQQINEPLTPDVHSPQEEDAKSTPDPYVNQEIRTPAIPIQDLPEYVRVKKAAGELAGEWELLPEGVENKGRASAAFETNNTTKNRYRNVVPYDEHRVVLEKVNDDPFSDYINACFIKGFTSEKAYIAAQGPNKTTVADFWRMIWQENVCTIVMTTNLVEDGKNKCIKYWPEEANRYGDVMVSSYDVVSKTSFIIRKLKMVMGKEVKFVKQYHFLVWPDKNIPRSSSPVITMLKVIQNENPPNAGPIVVHCSAGAGRTGAIIAIDAMMSMAQETGEVNVFEFVKEMRKRRPNMVQTPLQYEFVYDTLLEFVVFGETSCTVSDFKERYKKLRDINPKSKKTYLSEEFEALQSISSTISASTKGGLRPENRDKNRYPDIIPFDRNRPFIMTPGENGPSDYINASFFDSFDKKDMFLGTQAPMENTVEDFWRMVADYNSRAIVVLNDLHHRDKTVAQFWPGNSLKLTFKHLTVSSSTSEHLSKQIKVHTVDVMKTDESGSLNVRIFEYLGWPADSYTPTSSKEFLQLVTVVNKWQSEIGDPTVVVMCMEGLGRTGVFCATMSSLRRLTEEQTVDIVQGVKLLRNNRPGMVQTLSQYEFIYKTVLEHLLAFEVYDNVPQEGEEALYANV